MSENFKGFVAEELKGNGEKVLIREKNMYHDKGLMKVCATNWHEVDQDFIFKLALWHDGQVVKTLEKYKVDVEGPQILTIPDHYEWDWIFYHTGTNDLIKNEIKVISRTIGYEVMGQRLLWTVDEETGKLITR